MKFLTRIEKSKEFWFLLVTTVIFFLLRLPSLFEPYWYGDEGIYEVIGFALRHGRLLYSDIWDNKPPVLYLIYALFSGDQMAAKFLSLLAGIFATWAIFFLSKKLFQQFLPSAITTSVFAFLFAIPLIEGNIANAENFMLLPNILAGLLVWKAVKQNHKESSIFNLPSSILYLLLAGLLLGISFLTKVVAMFDLSAFAVFIFILALDSFSLQHVFTSIKRVIPLVVGFLIPIFICAGFFIIHHTFSIFIHATLFSNVGYVNYGNQFLIPQGFLILKTLLVGIVVLFFLLWRKRVTKETLFIFLWIAFSLYAALFSGRPYTHYALVLLPGVTLCIGLLVTHQRLRILYGTILFFLVIFVLRSFTFYAHPLGYYENFLGYVLDGKSEVAYQSFFDPIVPRDYALAQFINLSNKKNAGVLVWGNSGQIYKLTNTLPAGRFIVAYHMTMTPKNIQEAKMTFLQHPPHFIIALPNQDTIPFPLSGYQERIIIDSALVYEHVL